MIDWIVRNKDWLFSGIGVTVVTALFFLIRALLTRHNRPVPSLTESKVVIPVAMEAQGPFIYHEKPSPTDIKEDIRSQPLLMQQQYMKSYIGYRVIWKLQLTNAWEGTKGRVTLYLEPENSYPDITTTVDIAAYPELLRKKKGAVALISGRIVKIETLHIELDCERLTFVE